MIYKCKYCGKEYEVSEKGNWDKENKLSYGRNTIPNWKFCCYKCGREYSREKSIETRQMKAQDPRYYEDIVNKRKNTTKERHGFENYRNVEKSKESCIKKYGVSSNMKSEEGLKAYQKSLEKKYGVKNQFQREEVKEHNKKLHLKNYGVEYVSQSEYYSKKSYETKKKNNSFKVSREELKLRDLLLEKFPDLKYQYKSELYPFQCDFYIPSLELYIEYQGHWSHGGKPFEGIEEDLKKLQNWQNKNTPFYLGAVETWTKRDVKKRETARQNNLNWIEFFTFEEALEYCTNL